MTVTWKKIAYFTDIAATKLDDFAAPDNNTDLNATTAAHGLCLKGDTDTTHFLRGDISWAVPSTSVTVAQTNRLPAGDLTVPAGYSTIAAEYFEIASGYVLDILSTGTFEVIT